MDIDAVLDRLEKDDRSESPSSSSSGNEDHDLYTAYGTAISSIEDARKRKTAQSQKERVYLNMIQAHPKEPESYFKLSQMLMDVHETVTLRSGERVTRLTLLLRGYHNAPNNAKAIFNILREMTALKKNTIELVDGTTIDRKELCLRIIQFGPSLYDAYYYLARLLTTAEETVELKGGAERVVTRKDLLLDTLRLQPNHFRALLALTEDMEIDDGMALDDGGEVFTKKDLLLKAVAASERKHPRPLLALAVYLNVAKLTSQKLLDGTTVTPKQLYTDVLELEPNNGLALHNLALQLKRSNDTLKLNDSTECTKRELLLRALKALPREPAVYSSLAYDIPNKVRLRLPVNVRKLRAWTAADDIHFFFNDNEGAYQTTIELLQTDNCSLESDEDIDEMEREHEEFLTFPEQMSDADRKRQQKAFQADPVTFTKGRQEKRRLLHFGKEELYHLGGVVFTIPAGMEKEETEKPPEVPKKRKKKWIRRDPNAPPRKPKGPKGLKPGTRERLIRFFEANAPEKLPEVEKLLPLLVGREDARFRLLVEIYGPEPPDPNPPPPAAAAGDVPADKKPYDPLADVEGLLPPVAPSTSNDNKNNNNSNASPSSGKAAPRSLDDDDDESGADPKGFSGRAAATTRLSDFNMNHRGAYNGEEDDDDRDRMLLMDRGGAEEDDEDGLFGGRRRGGGRGETAYIEMSDI